MRASGGGTARHFADSVSVHERNIVGQAQCAREANLHVCARCPMRACASRSEFWDKVCACRERRETVYLQRKSTDKRVDF